MAKGKYHFNFANPAAVARIAARGQGPYKEKIALRSVGVFPSWDRLVFAVRKDTGIQSLDEIKILCECRLEGEAGFMVHYSPSMR